MATNPRESKSSAGSVRTDGPRMDFPAVTPSNAPRPHPAPTAAQIQAHARELLRSVPAKVWEDRLRGMNPNRFVL